VNDLESVVKKAADRGSLTLYLHISCNTFLCMSVHHNNKRHNGGLQLFCLDTPLSYGLLIRLLATELDMSNARTPLGFCVCYGVEPQ
jgi:hypothetical protein